MHTNRLSVVGSVRNNVSLARFRANYFHVAQNLWIYSDDSDNSHRCDESTTTTVRSIGWNPTRQRRRRINRFCFALFFNEIVDDSRSPETKASNRTSPRAKMKQKIEKREAPECRILWSRFVWAFASSIYFQLSIFLLVRRFNCRRRHGISVRFSPDEFLIKKETNSKSKSEFYLRIFPKHALDRARLTFVVSHKHTRRRMSSRIRYFAASVSPATFAFTLVHVCERGERSSHRCRARHLTSALNVCRSTNFVRFISFDGHPNRFQSEICFGDFLFRRSCVRKLTKMFRHWNNCFQCLSCAYCEAATKFNSISVFVCFRACRRNSVEVNARASTSQTKTHAK